MGDILEFPSQQAQGLAYLDRQVRSMLQARGADPQSIAFAAEQLTSIYSELSESEQYHFSIELPSDITETDRNALETQINEGLEGIRRENHALMVQLVAQLVLAKLRLFQHERPE